MSNAVIVSYSVSRWQNQRTDKKIGREIAEQHGVNSKVGRYQKVLIQSKLYDDIKDIEQEGRDFFYAITLPWQHGASIVNIAALDVLREKMSDLETRFDTAVDVFIAAWPTLIENAGETLGSLFRASDYPTANEVKAKFAVRFGVQPMIQDKHFDEIAELVGTEVAAELAGQLQQQQTEQWQTATRSVWQRLFDTLKHAERQLSFGERIHDSVMGNLQELADLLPILNVTNDAELETRRKELNSILAMYSTESVKDKSERAKCASDVTAILSKFNL